MNTLKITIALAAAGLFATAAQAENEVQLEGAKVGHWTMDFDAAKKLAKEKNLPMMLNFTGSDWCHWCKIMDKSVFAKKDWVTYAEKNAVLVTVDFPRKTKTVPEKFVARNNKLKSQFMVQGYPTFIILDSDGKTKLGQLGAGKGKTPKSFIKEFDAVTRFSAANIEAYVKRNPKEGDAYKKAITESREATKALTDWIKTRPQRNKENNAKFKAFQEAIKKADKNLKEFK